MKLKLKNKLRHTDQQAANKSPITKQSSSWEMSAESALRVDYVTRNRSLPLNHN